MMNGAYLQGPVGHDLSDIQTTGLSDASPEVFCATVAIEVVLEVERAKLHRSYQSMAAKDEGTSTYTP